jgi:hypothetical protein
MFSINFGLFKPPIDEICFEMAVEIPVIISMAKIDKTEISMLTKPYSDRFKNLAENIRNP